MLFIFHSVIFLFFFNFYSIRPWKHTKHVFISYFPYLIPIPSFSFFLFLFTRCVKTNFLPFLLDFVQFLSEDKQGILESCLSADFSPLSVISKPVFNVSVSLSLPVFLCPLSYVIFDPILFVSVFPSQPFFFLSLHSFLLCHFLISPHIIYLPFSLLSIQFLLNTNESRLHLLFPFPFLF